MDARSARASDAFGQRAVLSIACSIHSLALDVLRPSHGHIATLRTADRSCLPARQSRPFFGDSPFFAEFPSSPRVAPFLFRTSLSTDGPADAELFTAGFRTGAEFLPASFRARSGRAGDSVPSVAAFNVGPARRVRASRS